VEPVRGRVFTPEEDRYGNHLVTLISHEAWTPCFGQDPTLVGRPVKLSENAYTVLGVRPPGFSFESGSQFWIPVTAALDPRIRPTGNDLYLLGRLSPGAPAPGCGRSAACSMAPRRRIRSGTARWRC